MQDDDLEAAVRITEALIAKMNVPGNLYVIPECDSNAQEIGQRTGQLFKAIYDTVVKRDTAS